MPGAKRSRDVVKDTSRANSDQAKAAMFCQLARFLVWGQRHTDLRRSDQEFDSLLRASASTLERAGTLEAAAWGNLPDQITCLSSQNLASGAAGICLPSQPGAPVNDPPDAF